MGHLIKTMIAVISSSAVPCVAIASETVSYSYDAKGRLIKVVHTGTVNNGVTKEYTHDKADNRKKVKVAGVPQ